MGYNNTWYHYGTRSQIIDCLPRTISLPRYYEQTIYFLLRQFDEFTVAAPTKAISNILFENIQAGRKQRLKLLGLLTMFNGLDITQSKLFVKILCRAYLTKILEGHNWLRPTQNFPISSPMNHDKKYMKELELTIGPTEVSARIVLEKDINFSCR